MPQTNDSSFVTGAACEELLTSTPFELEDHNATAIATPNKGQKIRLLSVCRILAHVALIVVVAALAFSAGWASSWVTNDSINNKLQEGSWTQSPVDDVKPRKFESVMEIGNAELQVINAARDKAEWGGITRDAAHSTNLTAHNEELGDRTVLKDPVTLKPAFYIDREYVRDLAFGQIVDETGKFTDESFRFTITDAVTGDVAEIVPMSLSLKENFDAAEEDESLSAGVHPTFYFEWNKDKRAILQANAEEGDMDLLWPKNSGDVERANSFLERFMALYEPFIEAQSALSFDENDLYIPGQQEVYYNEQDGTIEARSPRSPIKRTTVEVRGNILSAWFQPNNCWVTYCRPIQIKKWVVTKSRSRCGAWLSFGRWIIQTVSKRCYECPRRDDKCNGFPASDPRACSGNGECKKGKCQCKAGFAGNKCDTCSCRYDKTSYPQCNKCEPKYGGNKCEGCADGYWPSPLCWIKRQCHGIYFDKPNVCSGHGTCSDGISLLGTCTCHTGWKGPKCNQCATNFEGSNCDKCKSGFAGPKCDKKIRCGGFDYDSPLACSKNGKCKIQDPQSPEGVCDCKDGYFGTYCDKKMVKCHGKDATDPEVCRGHGTCVAKNDCSCHFGYYGEQCQHIRNCNNVPSWDPQVCGGAARGTCVGNGANTRCECKEGWSGSNCDVPTCNGIAAGTEGVCSKNGECVAPDKCQCKPGFFGPQCNSPRKCNSLRFDDPNVCSKHGECVGDSVEGECQCASGWSGAACDVPLCFNVPSTETATVCSGNGECQGPDNCLCNDGYSGSRCDVARTCGNIPFYDATVCNGNGVCSTGGKCSCQTAFNGTLCESCAQPRVNIASKCTTCLPQFDISDFPDCMQCHVGFGPAGDCTQCVSGYFPSEDECHECGCDADGSKSNECDSNGVCSCKDGYNGSKCSACDADHYENADGQCVACECNVEGTIGGDTSCGHDGKCECSNQFSGKRCDIKRQCFGKTFDSGDVCSGHGACIGENQCSCAPGWSGAECNVPMCYNIESTNPNVCSGHGACGPEPNTCTCEFGFSGDTCCKKLRCNGVDFSSNSTCSGNGNCDGGKGDSGTCTCFDGFKGANCDLCTNERKIGDKCEKCEEPYTGAECESCASDYYEENNGCSMCACSDEGSTGKTCSAGTCDCKPGYKSTKCSEQCGCYVEGSESITCDQNSGQCTCKPGWGGLVCDTPRKCFGFRFDDERVCGGHGRCVAENTCACEAGYEAGDECAPSAPSCFGVRADDPSACSGNGQCMSTDSCKCNAFFAGKNCEVEMAFSHGSREHYFPTTTGRVDIIDGPDLPHGETYVWTLEVLGANVYWPGREGFNFGVAGFPLADGSFHEVGDFAGEYAFRGRDGKSFTGGVELNFGSILRNTGDQIMFEMNTVTGVLNVYTKRVGSSEFTLEGGKSLFTGVFPTDGRVLRPAVSGICWQPCGVKFVE